MKKYMMALSALALLAFSGCDKWAGDTVTQEFAINGTYTELVVEDAFDVTVSEAVSQAVVKAGENDMSKVRVELDGTKLKIHLKGWATSYGDLDVTLPYNPNLKSVHLSGASDFRSTYVISNQNVALNLSGASKLYCIVEADQLDLTMSGSSMATIDGAAGSVNMNISGSSDLIKKIAGNRYYLVCDKCKCYLSGSSEAYIHCDGSITGSVSGSSSLHYTGNATTTGCSTSGSSKISHDVL